MLPLSSLCVVVGSPSSGLLSLPIPRGMFLPTHCSRGRAGGEQPEGLWSNGPRGEQGSPPSALAASARCSSHSPRSLKTKHPPPSAPLPFVQLLLSLICQGKTKNRYKIDTFFFSIALLHHPFLPFGLRGTVPALTAITTLPPGTWCPAHIKRFVALRECLL